jgi:hypothetical protein
MAGPAAQAPGLGGREITFRPVTREDFVLLCRWLSNPEVQAWWRSDTRTLGDVEQEYCRALEKAGFSLLEERELNTGDPSDADISAIYRLAQTPPYGRQPRVVGLAIRAAPERVVLCSDSDLFVPGYPMGRFDRVGRVLGLGCVVEEWSRAVDGVSGLARDDVDLGLGRPPRQAPLGRILAPARDEGDQVRAVDVAPAFPGWLDEFGQRRQRSCDQ